MKVMQNIDYIRKMKVKHHNKKPIPIRAYECNRCGYWHLTSKPLFGYKFKELIDEKEVYEPILKDKWLKLLNNE